MPMGVDRVEARVVGGSRRRLLHSNLGAYWVKRNLDGALMLSGDGQTGLYEAKIRNVMSLKLYGTVLLARAYRLMRFRPQEELSDRGCTSLCGTGVEVRDMGQLVSPLHGAITVQIPRGNLMGEDAMATVVRVEKTAIHGSQGACVVLQGNPSSLHLDNNGASLVGASRCDTSHSCPFGAHLCDVARCVGAGSVLRGSGHRFRYLWRRHRSSGRETAQRRSRRGSVFPSSDCSVFEHQCDLHVYVIRTHFSQAWEQAMTVHHNLALDVRRNTENRSPLRTQPAAGFRLAYAPLPLRLDGNTAAAVSGHGFVLGAKYAPACA